MTSYIKQTMKIKNIWRTLEKTTRYQSDPIGHVINLSKKTQSKVVFLLLKKNLNFIPKTPKFYLQLKIHQEGNPSRPVVSSMNSHTTNISTYVDYHLQPIVKEIPSYVKYTRFSKEFRESKRYTRSKHSSYIRHKVIYKHSK